MATRYWVGGAGVWNTSTKTHWSATSGGVGGASVPTSADDVVFDLHSNESSDAAFSVACSGTLACNNLNVSFVGTTKITFSGGTIPFYGNLNLSGGSAQIDMSALTLAPSATSGTKTMNFNGVSIGGLYIGGSGGTFQLASDLIWNGSSNLTLSAGTFDPNSRTVTATSSYSTISGTWNFYNLTIQPSTPTKLDNIIINRNISVSNNLTITGGSLINRVFVNSNTLRTTRTIDCTGASVNYSNVDFQDITITSGTLGTNSSVGDCGGNTGITFTTPTTQHWVNSNGGNWSDSANWTSRVPLPQDDVVMDCAFGTSKTVTQDMDRTANNISWTGATWTTALTWAISATTRIYGSLTMISGLNISGTSYGMRFESAGDATFTTFSNVIFTNNLLIRIVGTFNLVGTFVSSSKAVFWNFSSGTLNAGTSTIKMVNTENSAVALYGGSQTYFNLWFDRGTSADSGGSNIAISGNNSFQDFRDTGTEAHTIKFTAGTTQTFKTFRVNGSPTKNITITSTSTATHNLVIGTGGGVVSCNYLTISHSVATPANVWYAGTTSTDSQAIATAGSGWLFVEPPIKGNFFNFI